MNITGDIDIIFANMNKIYWTQLVYVKFENGDNRWAYKSTEITGDISVFGDKYDLEWLQIYAYTNVYGQVKDLKNLKKIYYVGFYNCNCTGSKTDLYNGGVNVTNFLI